MNIGKLQPTEITVEMKRSYLDYAMSVIVSRALPDVRDGLKPVHRRILFAMHQLGLHFTGRYTKSAKVVGEVLGKYHPHGDMPVYDALVRLAQDFSMRYPLIAGQGNFGSVDGDPPAAMRYTEVKLAKIAEEMMLDLEKETVNFSDNFDGTLKEPDWLPAKLPNLLLMGSDGIAVGMATKIPPHNLSEVVNAIIFMLDKAKIQPASTIQHPTSITFDVTLEDLLGFITGPDFPTAGAIYDIEEIKNAYATGRGKIIMRGKAEIEDIGNGKSAIIVTELPYQVNKAQLVSRIAQLVKDKKIDGISDLRDESDRHGIRMVVELKRDSVPKKVLNNLFKHTELQSSFPVNMVALVDGTPQTLTLKMIIEEYIKHRHAVIKRRSEFELKEAKAREHILEGLKIAVDHIDAVIETIKRAKDVDDARNKLMSKFSLTEIQAQAILDMQLKRLAALERQKIEDELSMIRETIAYLTELLANPKKILKVVKDELLKLKEKYGDSRRTKVYKSKVGEFSDEQLIPNEETVIVITKSGYVKRQSPSSFKLQGRGGKGVIGITTKEADTIEHFLSAYTHDNILFFTNKGKVYQLRVWDLPEGTRISKGQAIVNLINIDQNELVTSVLSYALKGEESKIYSYIVKATKKGTVKKSRLSEYENIRRNGLIAIKLESQDELCWAKLSTGDNDILIVSHEGKSIKFSESEVRATGRDTMGVRGILIGKDDYVVTMEVIKKENKSSDFLAIMEKGVGKKTAVSGFPKQHRGGQGVKVAQVTPKTGKVAHAQMIPADCQDLVLTSYKGQVVKLPISSVPRLSRATSGVILMRFSDKSDGLAAATCLS
ncbi:DNA gyrase subunit A [Candidatus Gottesmanbacteria bacterium]|nr:DNA gyrase subunit A [Candidatus Gottesmanbacteria bacterium]